MPPPLVLDTNAVSDPDFLNWLKEYTGEKLIPAFAYAEVVVYILKKKRSVRRFDHLLRTLGIRIEYFTPEKAKVAGQLGHRFGEFSEKARDYMIAAHAASAPRVLVTENKKDFTFLGKRVMNPDEVVHRFGSKKR